MEPISPKHITVTDPFWAPRIRTVADIVLPYQWQVLHDQVPGAPKSSCIANFQRAAHAIAAAKAGGPRPTYPTDKWYYDNKNSQENAFMGWVFQDSDLYKWLEAAAYAIPYGNRAYLTEKSREAVEIIAAAQETDGYLDTLYSINGLQNRFTNLKDYHELYCFGHLAQAACARWTMQGERDLLDIACRAADCICRTFGKGKRPGYPGHPLAELALVQLYEVTGKADYLQTADFFIRTRGTRPLFFDRERGVDTDGSDYIYNQAHCPLTAQTTAVGHTVRGVYLYAGAAAVAEHTGNRALQAACETLWQDLCRTKLYVTGALGQTAVGEAFGPAYYLPNDLAYGESCASAGLVFFAQRLYRCHPHAAYGAVAELALWNTIAGAMSADGCHFYYANPLEAEGVLNDTVPERKRQALRRQNWFDCACCPPNVARVTAGIGQYGFYADDNSLAVELPLGAQVDTPFGHLQIISALPESGVGTVQKAVPVHGVHMAGGRGVIATGVVGMVKENFLCVYMLYHGGMHVAGAVVGTAVRDHITGGRIVQNKIHHLPRHRLLLSSSGGGRKGLAGHGIIILRMIIAIGAAHLLIIVGYAVQLFAHGGHKAKAVAHYLSRLAGNITGLGLQDFQRVLHMLPGGGRGGHRHGKCSTNHK